ncbi:hypothetical protein Raf01_32410 [Rugosimonospora africana]|uniref:Alpha-glucosidase n=1 Tax=Rugosimonospora africana TaxID=556532 RepID=A0A8J3VQE8_9ACTN|nr:hypothetical protein Raf01_32410 [Rugosimonospora africana]
MLTGLTAAALAPMALPEKAGADPGSQPRTTGHEHSTLESSALRVEVTASPYSYRVIEKSTGHVLVSQSETRFTAGSQLIAAEATVTSRRSKALEARLSLVGTSDTARVRFTFTSPEVLQVSLALDNGAASAIREQFVDRGEHYYGLWEYSYNGTGGALDNRGAEAVALRGSSNPPVGSGDPSARAPFYLTSGRYAVYAPSEASARYTTGVGGVTNFEFDSPTLTYHVIYGPTYAQMLQRFNTLAGGALMPPLWAFEPIFWRDDHTNATGQAQQGAASAQELVRIDADNLQRYQIPSAAMWIDRPVGSGGGGLVGWGNFDFDLRATSFPDPEAMIADLARRGMHLLVWIANRANNSMLTDPAFTPYLFDAANGWPIDTANPGVDLRQREAYDHFRQRLQEGYVNLGVRGYKIDRGEQGEYPAALENELGVLMTRMARESVEEVFPGDGFVFGRNAHDTSRRYVAVWNGDSDANASGLADSVKQVIRAGVMNFSMAGSDTGGYSGTPNKETFARWLEFSTYVPMMEVLLGPNRTIWTNYDQQLIDIARTQTQAHHDLIPYARSYQYASTKTGMAAVRAMPIMFENDPAVADMWDEYLYGNELLVAPVIMAGATSRQVYLPAGTWIDYNDKTTTFTGPATITAVAPLDTIPVYVRAGAIVPRGDIVRSNNNWTPDWAPTLSLEVFPARGVDGFFDYYTGGEVRRITCSTTHTGAIRLRFGNLGTGGAVQVHVDHFSRVTRNGVRLAAGHGFQFDPDARRLTVPFSGATDIQIK